MTYPFLGFSSLGRPLLRAMLVILTIALTTAISAAAPALEANAPKLLPGTHGKFDFLTIDPGHRRLLAAHAENGSLDVIDLEQGTLIKAVATGAAQDCVVDAKHKRYLVSVSKPSQLAVVDAESLEVTDKVPLSGPADLLAWHEQSETAWVCHDDAKELWVVSPQAHQVVGSVTLPTDSPEDLRFDAEGKRLFQAMKTAGTVDVIDVATRKVTGSWPTAPAKAPHGMVIAAEVNGLLVAGGNGKLILLSQEDGHIMASADVPQGIDEIAWDGELHRVYCASGQGKISVHQVAASQLTSLGDVPSAPGAHSIAVDLQTHTVWIAYAKDGASYVQSFTANP